MSFHIGFLRVDKARYAFYSAHFTDSAGLSKKAEVKIAGMKVGWVDTIALNADGDRVTVQFMVLKKYRLFQNAHATIRQEGVLGGKYIDLSPGLSQLPRLPAGSILTQQHNEQASVDELFISLKKVAQTVCQMGALLQAERSTFTSALDAYRQLAEKLALLSQRLETVTTSSQDTIIALLQDTQVLMRDLKERVPHITHTVDTLANTLTHTVVPQVAQQYNTLTSAAYKSCAQVDQVLQKINGGEGFLGKLLCDKTTSEQLQRAVCSLDCSLARINKLAYALDGHVESINFAHSACSDFKSYARIKVQPTDNYFLLGGVVAWQQGYCRRKWGYYNYCDEFNTDTDSLVPNTRYTCFKSVTRRRNSLALDLQVGTIVNNWAFRFGIFESTAGCAFDWRVPLMRKYCTWVTSFELYDFTGRTRACYNYRPQLKWLNKLYFNPHTYFVFGAYDLMSKYNKSFFIGAGIRFGTDYTSYRQTCYL